MMRIHVKMMIITVKMMIRRKERGIFYIDDNISSYDIGIFLKLNQRYRYHGNKDLKKVKNAITKKIRVMKSSYRFSFVYDFTCL